MSKTTLFSKGDKSPRPWEVTSQRKASDPSPLSPRNVSGDLVSPRSGSARRASASPGDDLRALDKTGSKDMFLLLSGTIEENEIARRVIVGLYSTEDLANCGARLAAFGGDTEKYGVPDAKGARHSFTLLQVTSDVLRKTYSQNIKVVDLNPL